MIPNHKGEIPVALLLLPFVPGIVTGIAVFPGVHLYFLFTALGISAGIFILLNIQYKSLKIYKQRWLGGGLVALILFLFGWILPVSRNELAAGDHFSKLPAQYLIAKITDEPVLKNGLYRFTAHVGATVDSGRQKQATGTLLVTIKDSAASRLNYGDVLLIPARYSAVDPPLNPGEFNYKTYLAHKNIFYQAFLFPKQYTVLKTHAGDPLTAQALQLRRRLVDKLRQNIRDTDAYAVASALVLGYKADLGGDILEAYSKTGTVYVLTVSGAQVGILYLVLAYALGFLGRFKHGKLIKAIVIIAAIGYYALLTGFSIAVCRAALMLGLVLIGKTSRRYVNTLNILAASAFVLLCYEPLFITEAGFQLSYLAVFGVVILRPVVYKWFTFKNKGADKLWALSSFSIAIQLAIFPLCMLYFHQFPVYFLLSNLFVIVPSAIIMYAGVLFLALPAIPIVSPALAFVLEKTTVFMNKALMLMEHLPGATLNGIWLTTPEYLLLYALVICLFCFWYRKSTKWLLAGLVCGLFLLMSFSVKDIRQSAAKDITWLSLKKHQGIVFKNGHSAIVLTDLNPSDKTYKYSIQPYLDSCLLRNVKIISLNDDFHMPWLKKRLGLIRFLNTSVFICNGTLKRQAWPQKIKTNFICLTGNPDVSLDILASNFDFHTLIIDGTNSDQRIVDWQKQLGGKNIDFKILKRNKYFISVSN